MRRFSFFPVVYGTMQVCLSILGGHIMYSCQQEDVRPEEVEYSDDIYELKEYKVERHPPVVRNGFGMDMYHSGNSGMDTMYFSDVLPPYHPNNCPASGTVTCRQSNGEIVPFEYDLLFYNEFAYAQNYNGDYNGTGFPVIFLYTHPRYADSSARAAMVGQGIRCFNGFTADSIAYYQGALSSDPQVCMADYRTEMHTETVDGYITLRSDVRDLYEGLTIGNKFRPNVGSVFTLDDVASTSQIDLQPVFLILTREGLYAKFMVTRFKGIGEDTQKLLLQWQALKTDG